MPSSWQIEVLDIVTSLDERVRVAKQKERVEEKLKTGIATCGQGTGIFAMYLASQWLIDACGWRDAFLIIGLTFFAINLLAALVIRGNPGEIGLRPYGEPESPVVASARPEILGAPDPSANTGGLTIRQALRTRTFWLLYIGMSFLVGTDRLTTDVGISPLLAAGAVGMIGIGGPLSDSIGRKPTLSLCCALEAAAVLALAGVTHAAAIYTLITLMGFA